MSYNTLDGDTPLGQTIAEYDWTLESYVPSGSSVARYG
jgi:hypothetical protein